MAETVERPDDARITELDTAGDPGCPVEPAETVTPPRRFYANLADL